MTRPNYNLIRFIRRCIGQLKKEYGGPITIYKLGTATTNLNTGVKSYSNTSYPITMAVVLPANVSREVTQTISLISANKKLVQGGSYDTGKRRFIIDRRDVSSTLELHKDDWIVYDGRRYDILAIEEFEQKTAWMVVGKRIEGVDPPEDLYAYAQGYLLDLEQSVNATIA
jgi:hypothetical protein